MNDTLRIDKLLWFLRLAPTRGAAQALVEAGHIRVDGRRVSKPGCAVRAGAIIVLPTPLGTRSVRVDRLPVRRGGASEAATHYLELGAAPARTAGPAPAGISATDSQHGAHA